MRSLCMFTVALTVVTSLNAQCSIPLCGYTSSVNYQNERSVDPYIQSDCSAPNICDSHVACSMFYLDPQNPATTCTLRNGQPGLCCQPGFTPTDIPRSISSRPNELGGYSYIMSLAKQIPIPQIDDSAMNAAFDAALYRVQQRDAHIYQWFAAGRVARRSRHHAFHLPTKKALQQRQFSDRAVEASRILRDQFGLHPTLGGLYLLQTKPMSTEAGCPVRRECTTYSSGEYRTLDGTCNNPRDALIGSSNSPYQRILPPVYSDGIHSPRVYGKDGSPLASSRECSAKAFRSDKNAPMDEKVTSGIVVWGQILDHDLTHGGIHTNENGEGLECCEAQGTQFAKNAPAGCFPIAISPNDPFYAQYGQRCMNFVRSLTSPRMDCKLGYAEQVNQVTSWYDGSAVYGSSKEEAEELRLFQGGLMKTSSGPGRRTLLPRKEGKPEEFKAGDTRVNEVIFLATIHTILMRQHNRVAHELGRINPYWDDDKLYFESRKIVGAIIQHVTYNEFLPSLIGLDYMKSYGLTPLASGYKSNYDDQVDAQITQGFTTAAFRYGHTKIPGVWRLFFEENGPPLDVELSTVQFNNTQLLRGGGSGIDAVVRAFTRSPAEGSDGYFTTQLRGLMFKEKKAYGMDLAALNIQRGRDHGIPPYTEFREHCGLGKIQNWDEAVNVFGYERTAMMQSVYNHVDDIDLFVGGSNEPVFPDAEVGATFLCLIGDQFTRLQKGDRFYYEHGGQPQSFTPEQLQEIRKTSFSRLFCDNTDVERLQPLAMRQISERNELTNCFDHQGGSIPTMNLRPWAEGYFNK